MCVRVWVWKLFISFAVIIKHNYLYQYHMYVITHCIIVCGNRTGGIVVVRDEGKSAVGG